MADWYSVEEQARDQASKAKYSHLDPIPKHKPPFDPSLAKTLENQEFTVPRLKPLINRLYPQPVISLYLSLDPDRLLGQPRVYLSVFNSLRHQARIDHAPYLDTLSSDSHTTLESDFLALETFLSDYSNFKDSRSVIIFKSAAGLNEVVKLSVPVADSLVINSAPRVWPLVKLLDTHRNVLVVHLTQKTAAFFLYRLGELVKLDSLKSFVPSDSVDASRPNKVQRRRLHMLEDHLKQVAAQASVIWRSTSCKHLVIAGEERMLSHAHKFMTQASLPAPLPLGLSLNQSPHELTSDIDLLLNQAETDRQIAIVGEFKQLRDQGQLLTGLKSVLAAQNRRLLRRLLVDEDYSRPGFICALDRYLSLSSRPCPLCRRRLIPIHNLIDELVELALADQLDLHSVSFSRHFLTDFDHLAAVPIV